jgi:hypothetical protein
MDAETHNIPPGEYKEGKVCAWYMDKISSVVVDRMHMELGGEFISCLRI